MMKKKFALLIFCWFSLLFSNLDAQTNTFPSTGNIGIGTISPLAPFHLYKSTDPHIRIEGGGNYSYMYLSDGTSNGFLIKNSSVSTANGATAGALYTYTESGYDFQHISAGLPLLTIKSGGNVGVGTTTPIEKLTVIGHISAGGGLMNGQSNLHTSRGRLAFSHTANDPNHTIYNNYLNIDGEGGWDGLKMNVYSGLWVRTGNANGALPQTALYINNAANIGIGTTTPTEKLSVNGNIRAKKLIVTQSGWSDYVFAKNYNLPPLAEVENYIKVNQHLPEVPSAKEVASKGINVGDTQALLLKKIEELTLYVIEQQKQINALKICQKSKK